MSRLYSMMMFLAGDIINNYYFPVLLIVGIIGNILSFSVTFFYKFTTGLLIEPFCFRVRTMSRRSIVGCFCFRVRKS